MIVCIYIPSGCIRSSISDPLFVLIIFVLFFLLSLYSCSGKRLCVVFFCSCLPSICPVSITFSIFLIFLIIGPRNFNCLFLKYNFPFFIFFSNSPCLLTCSVHCILLTKHNSVSSCLLSFCKEIVQLILPYRLILNQFLYTFLSFYLNTLLDTCKSIQLSKEKCRNTENVR